MTTKYLAIAIALCAACALSGCLPKLQGMTDDDVYYSPRAAYGIPLYRSPFRGKVEVNERCNATGGSTTFWDELGRFFRIDYLKIDEHPMAQAPRFASDQTLLNAVMNNYLREVLPTGQSIEDINTAAREYLKDRYPTALFVILNMNIDTARETDRADPLIRGTYYYGFLVFKRSDTIYVVQHYQPALMKNKMLQVLTHLADNMIVPGQVRSDSATERALARWKTTIAATRFGKRPAESEDEKENKEVVIKSIRPCG